MAAGQRTGTGRAARAAALVSTLAGLVLASGACSAPGGAIAKGGIDRATALGLDPTATPEQVAFASEVHHFEELPTMVATSDAVVVATVGEVRPGRQVGDEHSRIRFREVDLEVEEVLHGQVEAGETLLLEQEGWLDVTFEGEERTGEVAYQVEGAPWLDPGDRTMLFLTDKGGEEAGRWRLVSSQGDYDLTGGESAAGVDEPAAATPASEVPDPLVAQIEGADLADLRQQITSASDAAEAGEIEAQPSPDTVPPSEGDPDA